MMPSSIGLDCSPFFTRTLWWCYFFFLNCFHVLFSYIVRSNLTLLVTARLVAGLDQMHVRSSKTRSEISLPSMCLTMRWIDTSSSRFLLKWAWVISWDQFVGCWLYFWAWFVLTVVIFLVFHPFKLANKELGVQPGFWGLLIKCLGEKVLELLLECTPSTYIKVASETERDLPTV